jgi:hypothetical protein
MSARNSPVEQEPRIGLSKEYVAPDEAAIREYARSVCQALSYQRPELKSREVVSGLTEFLLFVAPITAKYLNTEHRRFLLKGYTRKPVKPTRKETTHV